MAITGRFIRDYEVRRVSELARSWEGYPIASDGGLRPTLPIIGSFRGQT